MKKIVIVLAMLMAMMFAVAPSYGAESKEVGSLYAFAEQPTCTAAGFVQINYVEGVTWYMDGVQVTVKSPSTRFYFPGGFQSDVYAVPNAGYQITADVMGTESRPFYLTVNATPNCYNPPVAKKAKVDYRVVKKHGRADVVVTDTENVSHVGVRHRSPSKVVLVVRADTDAKIHSNPDGSGAPVDHVRWVFRTS